MTLAIFFGKFNYLIFFSSTNTCRKSLYFQAWNFRCLELQQKNEDKIWQNLSLQCLTSSILERNIFYVTQVKKQVNSLFRKLYIWFWFFSSYLHFQRILWTKPFYWKDGTHYTYENERWKNCQISPLNV